MDNIDAMNSVIKPSLYHVLDGCPKSDDTWCPYQKGKLNGTKKYESKGTSPVEIRSAIIPIYIDLTKPEMLENCLHGKMQNANECFNGMIWERLPKTKHVGCEKLKLGVFNAIANFNYGKKASIVIMTEMNLVHGKYMRLMCDKKRKYLSLYKASDKSKKRRKIIRSQRGHTQDINIQKEGTSYEGGGY